MTVFRLIHLLAEMKDDSDTVFAEESLAFRNGRHAREAGSVLSVFPATVHAFHPYPLRDYNFLRIDESEIFVTVFLKECFQVPVVALDRVRFCIHKSPPSPKKGLVPMHLVPKAVVATKGADYFIYRRERNVRIGNKSNKSN